MNVWLDDKRPIPAGFHVHVINAHHAVMLIRCGLVDMISLDHDLGDEAVCGTGYVVAVAIEAMARSGHLKRRLTVSIHSQNPVGAERMKQAIIGAMSSGARVTLLDKESWQL